MILLLLFGLLGFSAGNCSSASDTSVFRAVLLKRAWTARWEFILSLGAPVHREMMGGRKRGRGGAEREGEEAEKVRRGGRKGRWEQCCFSITIRLLV